MEQQIKDRYHDTILREAMQRYGIAQGQLQPISEVENFIYAFERGPHAYIDFDFTSLARHLCMRVCVT